MATGIKVKVIKDSVYRGKRITTLQLKYHRYIHGEFMTHRVFSRNASSSRAIPVKTMLKQVWSDPAMPVHWGQNQPGMQARSALKGLKLAAAKFAWRTGAKLACGVAWTMHKIGVHKQIANRVLEPWQYIHVILTSTEWDNFFELRDHPDAQPEIRELACEMKYWMDHSTPQELAEGDWHIPYITDDEFKVFTLDECIKMSVARCARVSYLTHDGKKPDIVKDIDLHDKLVVSEPLHASPAEHQAKAVDLTDENRWMQKNFRGFVPYRTYLELKTEL